MKINFIPAAAIFMMFGLASFPAQITCASSCRGRNLLSRAGAG